jgi:hypothetical protein
VNPEDDLLFAVKDPTGLYLPEHIYSLLQMAKAQGHPLERGSYLGKMTIAQLDALVHGKTDA